MTLNATVHMISETGKYVAFMSELPRDVTSNWCQHVNACFAIKTCSARSGNFPLSLLGIPCHTPHIATLLWPASFAIVKHLVINFTLGGFWKCLNHFFFQIWHNWRSAEGSKNISMIHQSSFQKTIHSLSIYFFLIF